MRRLDDGKLRVLAIQPGPHFSVADVHRGWCKALVGLGCEVVDFNFEDRLDFYTQVAVKRRNRYEKALSQDAAIRQAAKGIETAAFEIWPAFVLVTSCFFVPADVLEILRARGMRVVMLFTESPYEERRQLQAAEYADLCLVNDPTNLEAFRAVCPASYYMPHAYDPDIHRPGPPDPALASDFAFVGTGFPSRIQFLEQVSWDSIDVALAGNWQALNKTSPLRKFVSHPFDECVDNSEAVHLYQSTKSSVNIYRRETQEGATADGWAMGPREVELAACGTFFLTESRGENRQILPMVPTFETAGEFEEKLRWFLGRDDYRDEIRLKAREAVADRTFDSNASRLLSLLGKTT